MYKVTRKNNFENILTEPTYFKATKEDIKRNGIQIDLSDKNIIVDGDFLVTLEYLKSSGKGGLWFPVSLIRKSYICNASQGNWETKRFGISLRVIADVEQ